MRGRYGEKGRDKLILLGIAGAVALVLIFISWPFASVITFAPFVTYLDLEVSQFNSHEFDLS